MYPAIFIDRDGVIIENRDLYVRTWDDVQLIPQALHALCKPGLNGYKIIIVTNQAGIGKGLIDPAVAEEINHQLIFIIAEAGRTIDGIYVCPHTNEDGCDCRKPKPGLLLRAARDHNIDLSRSVMIGDALTDMQAGQSAGVATRILVRTGRGAAQEKLSQSNPLTLFDVADDLSSAIQHLLQSQE